MRWAVALVVPGAVGLALLTAAFGALVSWRQQPLVDYGARSRLEPSSFPTTGLAVVGWALVGFALGVLAGLVWRRVLPAVATAFAAWFGLAFLAATYRGTAYLEPLRTTSLRLSPRNLSVDQWWTHGGVRVSEADINRRLEALGAQRDAAAASPCTSARARSTRSSTSSSTGTSRSRPTSRPGATGPSSGSSSAGSWPWPLVLLGTTFWLLRRRAA